ncbi:GDSL esterase/lipase At2g23540-like [Phalaenopsis equestris]|uniref:GDSL esterase/lipase At2g23540-like n=1 Tax=Phalaenopsis equestris TaxID=78828 RepID=UPI0009E3B9F5|nr:GDSL esterase/lipase At2g23540-like [Phalaenopsis equestris]
MHVKSLIYYEDLEAYKLSQLISTFCLIQALIPPTLHKMFMPLLLLPSLFSTIVLAGGARDRPPAIFVFGDSHVDSGNNNYLLTTLSKANHFPNGIDFKASGGMPTGRFTNGRTMADIIGEEVGQRNYAPPFLDRYTAGAALLNGVNYASGAGGILNKTGALYVSRLGMDVQIDYFNSTRQQLDEFLGKDEARELVQNAIFSITIGANDFLNNYLTFITDFEQPDTYTNGLMIALREQLTRLYYLDARKIVMGNIVPIGCIPYQTSVAPVDETGCAALPNQLATMYNRQLRQLLSELNQILPGSNLLYANLYDLFMDVITNHKSYGFETAVDACCGNGGVHGGMIACGPASSLCGDRSKYVYWDPYHPTEAANLIVAKKLVHGNAADISPKNIQQLL